MSSPWIQALRSVALNVPDLALAETFYTRTWHLDVAARDEGVIYLRGSGADAYLLALPHGIFWLWCFCVGLAATISHMAMTYALKFAPSATLAPLHYLEIVTATLFGYQFFGDFPNRLTWCGIVIIVCSGLYIIHREHRTSRLTPSRPLQLSEPKLPA